LLVSLNDNGIVLISTANKKMLLVLQKIAQPVASWSA